MIYKMLAVYDSKAEAYMRPFVARSTGEAIRSFSDEVNSGDKNSPVCHHSEDFILYELGTWDELTGMLDVYEKPKALNSGIDVRRSLAAV
jgi:hypothetical protein